MKWNWNWPLVLPEQDVLIGLNDGCVKGDVLHKLALLVAEDEAAHHADDRNQREDDDAAYVWDCLFLDTAWRNYGTLQFWINANPFSSYNVVSLVSCHSVEAFLSDTMLDIFCSAQLCL